MSIDDIVELIRSKQIELSGEELDKNQITRLVKEIQSWIMQMDFTLPEGTTVVAYSGEANTDYAWEVAREVSTIAGDKAIYIRDTPPGELLNDLRFTDALEQMLGIDVYQMVCNGYDVNGNRIPNGGCGFGDNIQSLADFISGQFMQRASGTSGNIVVLVPKGVIQDKVFAVTELKQIFANKDFNTINGISKENLKAIYNTGEVGRNAVYDILQKNIPKIISGYTDGTWTQRIGNGSCGYGENLLSLDDFVSKKLMGETVGANSNLIVLAPAGIDGTKVFGATELDAIFKNDTFNTINGIPKAQLQAIYNSKPVGIQVVYDILTATSKSAVGNTSKSINI